MEFRKATQEDFTAIKALYEQARAFLKSSAVDQWQNGYPEDELIKRDIECGQSYLCEQAGAPVAVFVASKKKNPDYENITDGWWRKDEGYIHLTRVAVQEKYRGQNIGGQIVRFVEKTMCPADCGYLKSDTHPDNKAMQRMLEKNGFQYAGIVRLHSGLEKGRRRVAYDKILKPSGENK